MTAVFKSVASRALTPADLGIEGSLVQLRGTFSITNGIATARIDMIEGGIKNPFEIVSNLGKLAEANGANALVIEGTLANERLAKILTNRYGLTTIGANDRIVIPLR
jgi:hypothetical protein